ncbi:hypothetical protein L7F22_057574 [Adiantum nelumboides]|nr:hypothetical protein [Adiantum nelumboides]
MQLVVALLDWFDGMFEHLVRSMCCRLLLSAGLSNGMLEGMRCLLEQCAVGLVHCFDAMLEHPLEIVRTVCCCSVQVYKMPRLKAQARAQGSNGRRKKRRNETDGRHGPDAAGRLMEVNVTVSIGGGDIDVNLLGCMDEFLKNETFVGICSVERGGVAFNLHFQMVARLWATSLVFVNKKVKRYLGWATEKPTAALVLCRALTQHSMHTFCGMVGYCLKDCDQPHFRKVEHNISADDMNESIELHSLYGVDVVKNKVCLTPANVFNRALMFWRLR